ncbi:TPA: AzlC family ABC transporter permease [Clostridioides difficile]|nr:AzlC family ABC transporter permease [Clostridioides difficile]
MERTQQLKESFIASIPIFLGYIPIGIVGGILLQKSGLSPFQIALMVTLVFGGSSQFIAASMISTGASVTSIVLTTFIVNLRHFLMSSNLNMYIKNKSPKFILPFCHTITDETFAVNYEKFTAGNWSDRNAIYLNFFCLISSVLANFIGAFLGESISIDSSISGFILTSMFIALIVSQIKNKIYIVVFISSIIISVILYALFKSNLVIIVTSILASLIGFFIEESYCKKEESYE